MKVAAVIRAVSRRRTVNEARMSSQGDLLTLDQAVRGRELAQPERDRDDPDANHGHADLGRSQQARDDRDRNEIDRQPDILFPGGHRESTSHHALQSPLSDSKTPSSGGSVPEQPPRPLLLANLRLGRPGAPTKIVVSGDRMGFSDTSFLHSIASRWHRERPGRRDAHPGARRSKLRGARRQSRPYARVHRGRSKIGASAPRYGRTPGSHAIPRDDAVNFAYRSASTGPIKQSVRCTDPERRRHGSLNGGAGPSAKVSSPQVFDRVMLLGPP